MKLQKRLSRRYKNTVYYKYILVLPESEVKKGGFKEGDELKIETERGKIRITKQ